MCIINKHTTFDAMWLERLTGTLEADSLIEIVLVSVVLWLKHASSNQLKLTRRVSGPNNGGPFNGDGGLLSSFVGDIEPGVVGQAQVQHPGNAAHTQRDPATLVGSWCQSALCLTRFAVPFGENIPQ